MVMKLRSAGEIHAGTKKQKTKTPSVNHTHTCAHTHKREYAWGANHDFTIMIAGEYSSELAELGEVRTRGREQVGSHLELLCECINRQVESERRHLRNGVDSAENEVAPLVHDLRPLGEVFGNHRGSIQLLEFRGLGAVAN